MSDTPASANTEALDFDRAEESAASQLTCTACERPIERKYFAVNGRYACEACSGKVIESATGGGTFIQALFFGACAAIAGAGVYYGIAELTGMEFGLISIIVGYFVGKAVRHGAGLRPGKRYRALAILLTYWSITATYIPVLMKESGWTP
jgi:hypothetical protein